MNDQSIRQIEMCIRVVGFLASTPLKFTKGSPGPKLAKRLADGVANIKTLAADQVSGFATARANSAKRAAARDDLLHAMTKINRCARGMTVTMPGLEDKFRMPKKSGDSILLSRAHAFATDALIVRDAFVNFEMAPKFIEDLFAKIQALEDAIGDHANSKSNHAATTGQLNAAVGNAMETIAQLDPIVENKLEGDPLQLSKWEHARHIERQWVYKSATAPAPAPNPAPVQTPAKPDFPAAA